ncbi:FHA domain-containing protein [Paenibacillus sp. 481]|nr:FHA domain-containing protein [Paenibacillus sp. 481]
MNTNSSVMIYATILLIIAAAAWAIKKILAPAGHEVREIGEGISKLVLLDEEGESVKEWYIQGETSLLVGKSSSQSEVDIDLSDSDYASLISKSHAVLNYAKGIWYVEDLESRNGIGMKRSISSEKVKLGSDQPHPLTSGNILYIANTRLLVK